MIKDRALRFLQEHVGHTEKHARHILNRVDGHITETFAGEDQFLSQQLGREVSTNKTVERFPESWMLHLLVESREIGTERAQYLVRHDLSLRETPNELDAMLTQAFHEVSTG